MIVGPTEVEIREPDRNAANMQKQCRSQRNPKSEVTGQRIAQTPTRGGSRQHRAPDHFYRRNQVEESFEHDLKREPAYLEEEMDWTKV